MEKEENEEELEEEVNYDEVLKTLETLLGKSREEALAKAIEDLASLEKILFFSDLNDGEIGKVATLKVVAKRYNLKWLDQHLTYNLALRVSRNRLGRKEIANIVGGYKIPFFEKFRNIFKKREEQEETII